MPELPYLTLAERRALSHVAEGTGRIQHVYQPNGNVYRNTARIAGRSLHKLANLGLIADVGNPRSTGTSEDSFAVTLTAKGRDVLDSLK